MLDTRPYLLASPTLLRLLKEGVVDGLVGVLDRFGQHIARMAHSFGIMNMNIGVWIGGCFSPDKSYPLEG